MFAMRMDKFVDLISSDIGIGIVANLIKGALHSSCRLRNHVFTSWWLVHLHSPLSRHPKYTERWWSRP